MENCVSRQKAASIPCCIAGPGGRPFCSLPAAYHCIFKLGFGTNDARAFIHSLLGASFYGAFSAKVLIVRTSGYPGWALPMAGGVLFAILMVLWLTSAFWLFGTHGVSL